MARAAHATPPASLRGVAAVATILLIVGSCGHDSAPSQTPGSASRAADVAQSASAPGSLDAAQSAAAPTAPAEPDGPTVEVPSSIDHSCTTDVTSALDGVLNAVSDNSTIAFPEGGCYRVDSTLTITKRHRLTIEGNGATLHTGTVGERDRKQLALSDSDDVTVRNLGVVGSNERAGPTPDAYDPKLAFQHAFSLSGVHRVLLAGLSAARVHGDFVYIGGHSGAPSSDVTVTGSKFDGSGRQGISVTNADRVLISDNDIANVARSLFDIETNTSDDEVRDVRITGNRTGAATNFWLANKGAGDNIGPVEVDGNTMSAATGGLLFAFGTANAARGPYIVRGNQLIANDAVHDEGSVGALLFANCHDVSVVGNRVTFPPGVEMPVIELRSSRGVDISGNDFSGASQPILSDATTTGLSTSS